MRRRRARLEHREWRRAHGRVASVEVERIDQVVERVRRAHAVATSMQQVARRGGSARTLDGDGVDPRLPGDERLLGVMRARAPVVVVLIGSKTSASSPAPKSGRITRSPRAVPRMIQTAWRTSSSYAATLTSPAASVVGGYAQPTPRNARSMASVGHAQPPISTVGAPPTIGAPQPDMSPMRSAGRPPISTVTLPLGNGVGGCGPAGRRHRADCGCRRRRRREARDQHGGHAGSGRRCRDAPVGSVTRAAGGIGQLSLMHAAP